MILVGVVCFVAGVFMGMLVISLCHINRGEDQ